MAKEFKSVWWSIKLLSGWLAEQEESCVSIWSDEGVGALQISAYRHDGAAVTDVDLHDFAEGEYADGAKLQKVSCGDFIGLSVSYVVDEKYWRKWFLREGSLLLYVTYNCDSEDKNVEGEAVNQMLDTLKSR